MGDGGDRGSKKRREVRETHARMRAFGSEKSRRVPSETGVSVDLRALSG